MWVSNTGSCAMIVPIAEQIIKEIYTFEGSSSNLEDDSLMSVMNEGTGNCRITELDNRYFETKLHLYLY